MSLREPRTGASPQAESLRSRDQWGSCGGPLADSNKPPPGEARGERNLVRASRAASSSPSLRAAAEVDHITAQRALFRSSVDYQPSGTG